jgi:hypothetical protein
MVERALNETHISRLSHFRQKFFSQGMPIHSNRKYLQNFGTLFQIESKLPEHDINGIFHNLQNPFFASIIMQVTYAEMNGFNTLL